MNTNIPLIICALERAQNENQQLADKLQDYDAELPAGDAELIGQAIELVKQHGALVATLEKAAAHVRPTCSELYNEMADVIAKAKGVASQ